MYSKYRFMSAMSLMAPSVLTRCRLRCLHTAAKSRRPTSPLNTSSIDLSVLPTSMEVCDATSSRMRWAVRVGPMSMFIIGTLEKRFSLEAEVDDADDVGSGVLTAPGL